MSGAVPPLPFSILMVWTRTTLPFAFYASITRNDFYKTSFYKCHTEHPFHTTLYGIQNSTVIPGSSESNRLSDFCELSMQSTLSHLTSPYSVMQQASDLIQTSNLHHMGFPEFTIIFAFCFRRSHYCWVNPRVQLNYCLLLKNIALILIQVSHAKVRLLDAYWPVTDVLPLKKKHWTEVSLCLVRAS
jgi:hypothetical protein